MTTEANVDAVEDDEDRLPWLEPIEDEESGPSAGKLIAAVLAGLVAIGVIVGGLFWLGNRAGGNNAQEEVIASQGDYKVRPDDPGGMKVDDKGETQVQTSGGTEQNASINKAGGPETPVNQPPRTAEGPRPGDQTQGAGQGSGQSGGSRPTQTAQAGGNSGARLSGPTIQVGAYPSEAAANGEWNRLTQRFPYLRGMQHAVQVHQRGGQTFYRLRAAGNDAAATCRRLQGAGQPCMMVAD